MNKFIRNDDIETRAFQIIRAYEKITGIKVIAPVPIEQILMQVYDLYVEWTEIKEENEITVLGGLAAKDKRIVLNSKHKQLFSITAGLERSTIGHEAGHWEYDIDKTNLENCDSLNFPNVSLYYSRSSEKYSLITSYRGNIQSGNTKILEDLKKYDSPDQARIVNRFAAALNMPIHLVKEYCRKNQIQSWSDFYKMKELFDVSSSALKVRLEQLKLLFIKDKYFFRSREEALGQTELQF